MGRPPMISDVSPGADRDTVVFAYMLERTRPGAGPGRPINRSCRPTVIRRGLVAPSWYSVLKQSIMYSAKFAAVLKALFSLKRLSFQVASDPCVLVTFFRGLGFPVTWPASSRC